MFLFCQLLNITELLFLFATTRKSFIGNFKKIYMNLILAELKTFQLDNAAFSPKK